MLNAQARHFARWPILGLSGPAPETEPIATTYNGELDTLKAWINLRLQWLDANIPGLCVPTSTTENSTSFSFKCYPNPTTNEITISLDTPLKKQPYRLYDGTGRLIKSGILESNNTVINTSDLPALVYFIIALDHYHPNAQKIIKE